MKDPSLRIESSAIINLRGVSTKLNKYIVFTMQTYKKLKFQRILMRIIEISKRTAKGNKTKDYLLINYISQVNRQVNNTQILSLCFSLVVENCVVGICNNDMFLEFHEFETKYLAGVYKRH